MSSGTSKRPVLYCFPHAGGAASAFLPLRPLLSEVAVLAPVDFAKDHEDGRGVPTVSFGERIDELHSRLDLSGPAPRYAFWGHSMGAIVAYELAVRLRKQKAPGPMHLFLSGMRAPNSKAYALCDLAELGGTQLFEAMLEQGGIPEVAMGRADFIEKIVSSTRRDLLSFRTYHHCYDSESSVLDAGLSVLLARGDPINFVDGRDWTGYTRGRCTYHEFDGDHFFVFRNMAAVARVISQGLVEANSD